MRAIICIAALAALSIAAQARASSTWLKCEVDYIKTSTGSNAQNVTHSTELYEFRDNPVALISYDSKTGERGALSGVTADSDFVRQDTKDGFTDATAALAIEAHLTIDRKTLAYNGSIGVFNHRGAANEKSVMALRMGKCKVIDSPLPAKQAF